MAYELDVEGVATAFGAGRRGWNGRTVRFETREVATLTVTSGRLAASDPLVNPNPPAFNRSVPTGPFPVELAVAVFDDDERVAYARVRVADTAPERWEMAVTGANDVAGLGPDEFFGYGVDAGTGCFMDAAAGAALERRMNAEPDYFETILDGLNATQRNTWSWLDLRPDPTAATNIVCFSSGWGDGSYPTFFGLAGEQVVQVVTDFMLLPDVEDGAEPAGSPNRSSARPGKSPFGRGALSLLRWIIRGDNDKGSPGR